MRVREFLDNPEIKNGTRCFTNINTIYEDQYGRLWINQNDHVHIGHIAVDVVQCVKDNGMLCVTHKEKYGWNPRTVPSPTFGNDDSAQYVRFVLRAYKTDDEEQKQLQVGLALYIAELARLGNLVKELLKKEGIEA